MFQSFSPFGQLQGLGNMLQSQMQQPQFIPRPRPIPQQQHQQQQVPVSPPVASGGTFVFTQASPALTWTINYPFIGQFPSVTITDTAGNVVLGDVQYITGMNRVIVNFSQPFAGVAYLNV